MPRIELVLPGEPKNKVEPHADIYRVTVERLDGVACSEVEARTVMSMFCIHAVVEEKKAKRRKEKTTLSP
jgi:hypothetical protein